LLPIRFINNGSSKTCLPVAKLPMLPNPDERQDDRLHVNPVASEDRLKVQFVDRMDPAMMAPGTSAGGSYGVAVHGPSRNTFPV
jgi:hypothetical protein